MVRLKNSFHLFFSALMVKKEK